MPTSYQSLHAHIGHKIRVVCEGPICKEGKYAIYCETCEMLISEVGEVDKLYRYYGRRIVVDDVGGGVAISCPALTTILKAHYVDEAVAVAR